MNKKNFKLLCLFALVMSMFMACQKDSDPGTSVVDPEIINSEDFTNTVENALLANFDNHENSEDYTWDASAVTNIVLNGTSISVDGTGASVNGSIVTITKSGTYIVSGKLTDGQIIINTTDAEIVRLILNDVNINCSTNSPIYVKQAKKTILVLVDATENYISDGSTYIFENTSDNEPNATIFSKDNLTISGNGSLSIDANYNDAISSKDGLIIKSGAINIASVDDGIRGKDYLVIKGGNIFITAVGDGIKSDNDEDVTKGYIYIEKGSLNITSGGDAIQAKTDVLIADAEITLVSGGGSSHTISSSLSAKGIKGIVNTIIENGTISINSADDAIHSNGSISINGGSFEISSGDDGVHADSTLGIFGGTINITKSYEGIESANILINSGNIHLISSDDGLNVAGGNDGSGMGGYPGGNVSTGNYYLYVNGGHTVISSGGDGVDVNGSVVMTSGDIIVNGPTANDNGALDYDGTFKISGGFILATGSSGMAMVPGSSSSQNSLLINFSSALQSGTLVHIQTDAGKEIFTFAPTKKYQSISFSSPELVKGTTYKVYTNGSSTGIINDGLYLNGIYTPGNLYTSFTISSTVTKIGNSGSFPGGK